MIMGLLISRVGRIKSGWENCQHYNVGEHVGERGVLRSDALDDRKRKGPADPPSRGSECVQNSHFTRAKLHATCPPDSCPHGTDNTRRGGNPPRDEA